jgi:transcriptional regulator with XRE-family HTH domain
MRSVQYLVKVKEKYGLESASALAVKLGLSKQAVSNYLNGQRVMDEETCLAVALALDINPVEIMMAAGIDRAQKTGQHSLWEIFSQRMAATAASALLAAGVSFILTPADAEAAQVKASSTAQNVESLYYVKWLK